MSEHETVVQYIKIGLGIICFLTVLSLAIRVTNLLSLIDSRLEEIRIMMSPTSWKAICSKAYPIGGECDDLFIQK